MKTSVSLNQALSEYVAEISDHAGENDAEAIRDAVRHARDLDERVDELEADKDDLTDEVESLRERAAELEDRAERLEAVEVERDDLRDRVGELERDLQRVRNEKKQILEQREENKELRRYVEDKRTVAQTEQQYREASITKRLKWKITGMPSPDEEVSK